MKKVFISVSLLLALAALVLLHSQNAPSDKKKSTASDKNKSAVEKEMDSIIVNYDSSVFKALYSLEDFKPNSVVSLDKTSRMYGYKWLSPETVLSKLDEKDKDTLIQSTIDYLRSLDNNTYRRNIIQKIKFWCMADQQFNFMVNKLGIKRDNILKAISNVPASKALLSQYMVSQSKGKTKISDTDSEHAYDTALNYIAGLPLAEQYKYISEVFNQLALITSK